MVHPDKNDNKAEATANMEKLNQAREALTDKEQRKYHDIAHGYISKSEASFTLKSENFEQ